MHWTVKQNLLRVALGGIACLAGMTGCASYKLPEVAGSAVEYRRTDPFGGTSITAKGVEVTETEVKADEATFTTTYPTFSVFLKVEGYRRKRE